MSLYIHDGDLGLMLGCFLFLFESWFCLFSVDFVPIGAVRDFVAQDPTGVASGCCRVRLVWSTLLVLNSPEQIGIMQPCAPVGGTGDRSWVRIVLICGFLLCGDHCGWTSMTQEQTSSLGLCGLGVTENLHQQ